MDYASRRRALKASALADVLEKSNVSASDIEAGWPEGCWDAALVLARCVTGQNFTEPSDETKAQVAAVLRQRAQVFDAFAGLEDGAGRIGCGVPMREGSA